MPVLFGQHGRHHERRRRMARRERTVVRAVRPHHMGGLFQGIHRASHQECREGVRDDHPSPRTTPLHAGDLHSHHDGCRSILQVVVRATVEPGQIVVAQASEMVVLALYNQPSDNQRNADIGHPIKTGRRESVESSAEIVRCRGRQTILTIGSQAVCRISGRQEGKAANADDT